MTDEFYGCGSCGVVDGNAESLYEIKIIVTNEQLEEIEAITGKHIDGEEQEEQRCSECGEDSTHHLVASTARC